VDNHAVLAAQLRARYAGTVGMDGFLKWQAEKQQKLAERRADITQREADLRELEARYEREGLWQKLPAPLGGQLDGAATPLVPADPGRQDHRTRPATSSDRGT
jgi:hypothetical protein